MKNEKTSRLVTSAMLIALAVILSMIPFLQMPLGGKLTLFSMLPICLIPMKYGTKWGLFSAFVYAVLQLVLDLGAVFSWGLTPVTLVVCILCDYLLAFTVLGFAGIFAKKGIVGQCIGVAMVVALRFLCHVISGGTIFAVWSEWENVWFYSICYNGAFMLPECIMTVVGAWAILKLPQMKKAVHT